MKAEEIDWSKESIKVKEVCDIIVKAHEMHKTMTQEEKDRVTFLMDIVVPQEE